mgnify:CR=1 FL=1
MLQIQHVPSGSLRVHPELQEAVQKLEAAALFLRLKLRHEGYQRRVAQILAEVELALAHVYGGFSCDVQRVLADVCDELTVKT